MNAAKEGRSTLHAERGAIALETGCICIVFGRGIKCTGVVTVKKKASDSLSSTALFHQTARGQLCRRQMEKKQILPPNLLELSVLQCSYFSRCQEGASPDDVTLAAGLWAVPPPPAHIPHPFILNAVLSPRLPGQFRSGFCHWEIKLKYQVFRAYWSLRLHVKVENPSSSTSLQIRNTKLWNKSKLLRNKMLIKQIF